MQIHKSGSPFDHESDLQALDLASQCCETRFFPFPFLINDSGDSQKNGVYFFSWNYHLRKCISSKTYWIHPVKRA